MTAVDRHGVPFLALQYTCLACLRPQWEHAVEAISRGLGGCTWCGKPTVTMTAAVYDNVLEQRRAYRQTPMGADDRYLCPRCAQTFTAVTALVAHLGNRHPWPSP
jgi:hypothetical protein